MLKIKAESCDFCLIVGIGYDMQKTECHYLLHTAIRRSLLKNHCLMFQQELSALAFVGLGFAKFSRSIFGNL